MTERSTRSDRDRLAGVGIPKPEEAMNALAHDHLIETYKSLVTLSTEGFKLCALANGGAAVAILAYLGNVAGKDPPVPVPDMRCAMGAFLAGLVFCGFGMFFAYLTQLERLDRIVKGQDTRGGVNGLRKRWFLRL
jgi:hypothetical protein